MKRTLLSSIVKVTSTTNKLIRYENPYGEVLAELKDGELVLSELGEAYGFSIKNSRLYELNATYPVD